ncbi:rhamnose ABC transporter substrate-binding protein [Enterobacter mori]|uniref:rhamnose ABC transporter substrate-binding protein n=1 Tax=Enterobacter mori TaxID=539813 RepID=UPI002ED4419E|nr:rhamnose ABC transporter substrate-binding protein [Enterobacter mori]
MKIKTSLILTVAALALSGSALAEVKIALVAKSLGNGFFEAANVGAQEAAKELGDVKVIYTGPTTTTAEAQIEVLNGLIAQGVDAIAISANDPDALVPVLKKAMQRGIKVVSWDSGVAKAGRQIHLNPSNNALIGETNVKLAADALKALKALNVEKGDVAVLSATPTSTNQNTWIAEMKKVLPKYPSVNLVTVAYGDDLSDKSYREAVGLLKTYPDLKVIVSPSSVGIVAAAQAVKDQGKIGKVYVTGLGLPSEMAGAVKSGASKSFAIWNPIDLGYAATYLADDLVKGTATKGEASMGKLGKVKLDADGNGAMAEPFVYDASNIDKFSKIF